MNITNESQVEMTLAVGNHYSTNTNSQEKVVKSEEVERILFSAILCILELVT